MWTPLHHACYNGHIDVAELIVKAGAAVDAPAIGNATPLMRAIEICRLDIVCFLISAGADIQTTNSNGKYQCLPKRRGLFPYEYTCFIKKPKLLEHFEKCSEFMIAVRIGMKVRVRFN